MRCSLSLSRLLLSACCAIVLAACSQHGTTLLPSSGAGFDALSASTGGTSWTPIGPTEPAPGMLWWWNPVRSGNSGKFNAVAVNPRNPQIMYIAAGVGHNCEVLSDAGIFKTTDGGSTWTPMDRGLTDTYVNDIWINPNHPNQLVAATEVSGLFFSSTSGARWVPVLTPVTAIALASDAHGVIYAGTSAGLYASTSGRTWKLVGSVPRTTVTALGTSGNEVFAGTIGGSLYARVKPKGPFQPRGAIPTQPCNSTSGSESSYSGATQTSGVGQIAIDPRNPNHVFATSSVDAESSGGSYDYAAELYETRNGGATWKPRTPPYAGTSLAESIAFSLVNKNTLYVGGDAASSVVAGSTWKMLPNPNTSRENNLTGDTRRLYVYPSGSGERIIAASDQGVWSSPQFTTTKGQYNLSTGISSNMVNDLAVTTLASGATVAALTLQDFTPVHTQRVNGTSTVWSFYPAYHGSEEDGAVAFAPAPNNGNCILVNAAAFALSSNFCATLNGGVPYYTKKASLYGDNSQVVAFSPTQPGLVYLIDNDHQVYVSQNYGKNATQETAWPHFTRLVVSPATTASWLYGLRPVYSCTASSAVGGVCVNLWFSADGGQKWYTPKYTSGKCPYVGAVAVNPVSPNIVVLACYTRSGVEIFESTNHGAAFAATTYAIQSDLRAMGNDYDALFRSVTPDPPSLKANAALAFFAYPTDLEFNPSPPSTQNPALILTTSRGGAISTNNGQTWSPITGNAISSLWTRAAWANGNAFIATRGEGVLMAPLQP